MYTTEVKSQELEALVVPEITKLRNCRYTLLDQDNDVTTEEGEQMSRIISLYADIYMHMRLINRTGGKLSRNSTELLEGQLGRPITHEKQRRYENDVLLNIHSQKLAIALEQLTNELAV